MRGEQSQIKSGSEAAGSTTPTVSGPDVRIEAAECAVCDVVTGYSIADEGFVAKERRWGRPTSEGTTQKRGGDARG